MKLVSVEEMKTIEKQADAQGLTYDMMMDNAGQGLAEVVQGLPVDESDREILGLVGPGNNGGDTLVALTHLAADDWRARAYLIKRSPDALVERLKKAGGEVIVADEDREFASLTAFIETSTILLDGVLGTGVKPPLKGDVGTVLAQVQVILDEAIERPYVIAVDCPSGVDCDSGEVPPECIQADLTVTMAAVKDGLMKLPAYELIGDLQVVDIGLPVDLPALTAVHTDVADADLIASILPERPVDAHKGTFGTALIAAGSVNYTGAASLAGKAAYRVGAGLVTLAVPSQLHSVLAGGFPEATWVLLPQELGVISRDAAGVLAENFSRASALLVGPGLGLEDTTADFIADLLTKQPQARSGAGRIGFLPGTRSRVDEKGVALPPLVVDADGLKLLAKVHDWHKLLPAPSVLTPHPGEMAILTGLDKEEIQKHRREVAAKFARQWGHVVVLKGAFTIVAAPDGRITLIPVASAALARAGTGDVLAGLIVGLLAQGVQAFEAAVAGAWIHAQAGLYAANDLGTSASVLAGDLLGRVPDVISDVEAGVA
jgi:hydroxyethylthiazole kinase-like uncharacterized protein yjeF